MNYKIQRGTEDQSVFEILETTTDQVVKTCADVHTAQIAKTHLNRGGGFDGWTPTFILQSGKNPLEKSKH